MSGREKADGKLPLVTIQSQDRRIHHHHHVFTDSCVAKMKRFLKKSEDYKGDVKSRVAGRC